MSDGHNSDTLDRHSALTLKLLLVPVLVLLFAVLQSRASVRLKHAVLAAEMTLAEAAVADNPLRGILALLEVAADLLWRATADGKSKMYHALTGDVVGR